MINWLFRFRLIAGCGNNLRRCVQGGVGTILPAVFLLSLSSSCTDEGLPLLSTEIPFNFHVIEEGQAYRSGQPTPEQLTAVIDKFGIQTVVNLRGSNPGKAWYDAEAMVCEDKRVALADHPMSRQSLPSAELLRAITNTLLTADYPILIHCHTGSNRTGAISAIYRILVLGHDQAEAMNELSPAYFHFRFDAPCMDTLVEIYNPVPEWLDEYAATVDEIVCTP